MIYFIQSADGPIKIGFTNGSPETRLGTLQVSTYHNLSLLGMMEGGPKTEKYIHALFEGYRIRGEWYSPCDSLVKYINDNSSKFIEKKETKKKKTLQRFDKAKHLIRLAELAQDEALDLVDIDLITSKDQLAKAKTKRLRAEKEEALIKNDIKELKEKKKSMLKDRKTIDQLVNFIKSVKGQ